MCKEYNRYSRWQAPLKETPHEARTVVIWRALDNPRLGFMSTLSTSIERMESRHRDLLRDLRAAPGILIASDYSGSHRGSSYNTYAFLFADTASLSIWEQKRRRVRERHLPNKRRVSFKTLNDSRRRAALHSFLAAADSIRGVLAIIVVAQTIQSLFQEDRFSLSDPVMDEFGGWSPPDVEKLLRIVHFLSLFLAGLSTEGQDVFWVTDDDSIAANESRLTRLTELTAHVASQYLPHSLGHLRVGTTQIDNGELETEDVVAIPDLAAGAIARLMTEYRRMQALPRPEVVVPVPDTISYWRRAILSWLSLEKRPLARVLYVIDEEAQTGRLRANFVRLLGTSSG